MSLIPSESYSFPDHFTITRAASSKPKNAEPDPEPVEPSGTPAIVALPNPKPHPAPWPAVVAKENTEPMRKVAPPVPNSALRRASAPPPRSPGPPVRKITLPPTLKPKVRWNNRALGIPPVENNGNGNGTEQILRKALPMPARNVIQMRPPPLPQVLARPDNLAPATSRPIVPPRPQLGPENPWLRNPVPISPTKPVAKRVQSIAPPARPVQSSAQPPPLAATPQTDFFEMFAETGETIVWRRWRTEKMRRFIVCESIGVGILLPLAAVGLFFPPQNAALQWILNILTISAAVAAALIPIIFFAATPRLPEIER